MTEFAEAADPWSSSPRWSDHDRLIGSVTRVRVTDLDHIVLLVADVERSLAWYLDVIGLTPVRVDEWHLGQAPFPSVRVSGTTIIDIVAAPPGVPMGAKNLDHLCLVVDEAGADDLEAWAAANDQTVLERGLRYGARGIAASIYIRDPDGNTVELRTYAPS